MSHGPAPNEQGRRLSRTAQRRRPGASGRPDDSFGARRRGSRLEHPWFHASLERARRRDSRTLRPRDVLAGAPGITLPDRKLSPRDRGDDNSSTNLKRCPRICPGRGSHDRPEFSSRSYGDLPPPWTFSVGACTRVGLTPCPCRSLTIYAAIQAFASRRACSIWTGVM